MRLRHRAGWIIAAASVFAAWVGWFLWTYANPAVLAALWTTVGASSLSAAQLEALARCEDPGWWAWVRITEQRVEHGCGEAWGRDRLAHALRTWPRRRYARAVIDDEARSAAVRARWAVALAAHDDVPPVAPGWLMLEPSVPQAWRDAWLVAPGRERLGARARLLGDVEELAQGGPHDERSRRAMLALLEADRAEAARVRRAAERFVGISQAELMVLGHGRPHGAPEGWARAVEAVHGCVADCGPQWVALADAWATDPEGQGGADPWPEPPHDLGLLAPLADLAGWGGARRAALSAWLDAEAAYLAEAPGRWVDDVSQPGEVATDLLRAAWTGRAGPWTGAALVREAGRRGGFAVVVERVGATGLVVRAGGRMDWRCGSDDGGAVSPVADAELLARAWLELAGDREGAQIASARLGGWASASAPIFAPLVGEPPRDPCAAP